MRKKILTGGLLTLALLTATGLSFAAAGPSVQVSLSSSVKTIAAGQSFAYTARFGCASSVSNCAAATLKIDIPSPLYIVGNPSIGGFIASSSQAGQRVTFVMTNPLASGSSGSVSVTVAVPTCNPIGNPAPGPLAASAVMDAAGATNTSVSSAVSLSPFPTCATSSWDPPLAKWGSDAGTGGMNDWGIHVQAKSGAYLVEDVFPAGVVVHNIAFDSGLALSVDCGAGFEFVSSQLLSASPQPVGCADAGQTLDQYRYQHLTRFRVTVPANTSGFIAMRTFLDAPLLPGDVVTNCVQALAPSTEKSCAPVTVLAGGALVAVSSEVIGAPNIPLGAPTSSWLVPDPISDSGTTKLGPRDLAYSIRAINYEQSAGDVVDPVITQVLDNNVSFVPGSNWWRTWVTSAVDGGTPPAFDPKLEPSCASPIFEELPNAVGTQTMLRWTFRGCTLHGGWAGATALGVYVSVRMKPAVLPGVNVVSEARVSQFDTAKTPAPINPAWCDSRIIDAADLDGDGSNTDMLCGASPTGWKAPQGAEALSATALVQGALDSVPTRYPASGTTNLSGSAQYQFELKNSGVSPMRSLDMVDTLPASGDTTVSAPGEARTSEWDSELVAIDRLERGDASGVYSVIPSSEYQVGVTSSRNPCRWDSADGDQVKVAGGVFASISSVTKPAGCTPNAWAAGPMAGALSFAIRYTPSVSLEPGGTLRITLHTALNGAVPPPGVTPLVSWNSIAYTATLDGSAGPVELLTGEPLKVGVRFADPASTASVGGFVWKDLNSNGIRDDGPASPVQGTAVSVYDASNVVVTTIYTDASGYYQLSGLNPDESYRLTVSMSPGVGTVYGNFITAANMGPDPLVSSQAVQKGLVAEVSGKTGAANTVDRRNNFGLAVSRAAT